MQWYCWDCTILSPLRWKCPVKHIIVHLSYAFINYYLYLRVYSPLAQTGAFRWSTGAFELDNRPKCNDNLKYVVQLVMGTNCSEYTSGQTLKDWKTSTPPSDLSEVDPTNCFQSDIWGKGSYQLCSVTNVQKWECN